LRAKRCSILVGSSVDSISRVADDRTGVAGVLRSQPLRSSVQQVVKPKSVYGGMRKVGAVLVASPDPITDIPGVALLASSFVMKRREPAGLAHLAKEVRRVMQDVQSLRL